MLNEGIFWFEISAAALNPSFKICAPHIGQNDAVSSGILLPQLGQNIYPPLIYMQRLSMQRKGLCIAQH